MYLPVQNKPEFDISYKSSVIDFSDIITKDLATELISFASGNSSGLHRRGSKSYGVVAQFSTCLIPEDYQIYSILDNIWKQYSDLIHVQHNFIEKYEIKMYSIGDSFGYHQDNRGSIEYNIMRKSNLIVQLSGDTDYEGGELVVGNHTCTKKFGTAILFPSYLLHCVMPITKGTRVSLIGHAWGPIYNDNVGSSPLPVYP